MGLPINIKELLHGKAIEWERLEFKKGWNPEDVIHTMCAFANDLNNWGGGYIIIGVEEENGCPILPPSGIQNKELDRIQGKILEMGYKIMPNYIPIIEPLLYNDKHIIVIWCPAGDNRPYSAPIKLIKNAQQKRYIRSGSRTIIARDDQLRRLDELAARIPFDDRVQNSASIDDYDLGLIQAFLQEIKSDLFNEAKHISLADLCRRMYIAKGPDENLRPINAGLLFFCREPERFFTRCWIELVWHKDDSRTNFDEKYFKGPLHIQIRSVLEFLKNNIISESVHKKRGKAEADRYYNFPFEAIEEVVSNAVYHKSYEEAKPIEIQVWKDKIEVLSFPGPIPPVDQQILKEQKRIVARDYRNRRIGDFLKELHLTEGRGTGFPTIYRAMQNNQSPTPIFETNMDCSYFLSIIPARTIEQKSNQVSNQANELLFNNLEDILAFCDQVLDQVSNQVRNQATLLITDKLHNRVLPVLKKVMKVSKRAEILKAIGLSNQTKNNQKYIVPLVDYGLIEMKYPDNPKHPQQSYTITARGRNLLTLIDDNSSKEFN